jgi:hypothetical protein
MLVETNLPKMIRMAKMGDNSEQVPIKSVAQWTDSNRTIHTKEDIIRGYVYGGKAIPVSGNLITIWLNVLT